MITTQDQITKEETAFSFNLETYLNDYKVVVDRALDESLPIIKPEKIYEAMRYSLMAGGKRIRPILCLAACELFGGSQEMSLPTACALEMIHTMSLIHDDLPAMDNDDYRRGKLTNHKVYGEDIAILAGDGLLAYAFEYVVDQTRNVPAERILQVIFRLGRAVGARGLVGGQVVDLDCEGKSDISVETLHFIHTHKTGALLETSVLTGAILAGAGADDLAKLTLFSQNIGLAFQIVDDILDITATQEELGKTAGKDLQAQKATYPSIWGLDESKKQAQKLVDEGVAALDCYGDKAQPLQAIAQFIVNRKF
jgi:geranylgeranyl diphosphate synthase, type II